MSNKKYMYGNSKCRIHWENDGFKEILNCDALGDVCEDAANRIYDKAVASHNDSDWYKGYAVERWHSNMKGGRIAARVKCIGEANEDEARNRTLSKAAIACRIK